MDDLKEALAATAEAAATHAKNAAERAARIEALEQHVSELEEALRPFAEACDECVDDRDSDQCSIWEHGAAMQIEFRHLRFARAALAKARNEQVKQ
jgi:hypothetical protein